MHKFMLPYAHISTGLAVLILAAVQGCAGLAEKNYRITGETRPYYADPASDIVAATGYGALHLPHSIVVDDPAAARPHLREKAKPQLYYAATDGVPNDQTICIYLNRCFLKYLEEIGKPEVLAYVEVEDGVGSKPIKNVLFQDDYQPAGALLNFQDAIVYGPTEFKGQPLTIRFYVYELDREENQVASAVVETVTRTAASVAGPYGLLADLIGDIVKAIISTNVDDREFYHQITLTPAPLGAEYPPPGATPLRTGTYVVVKKELHRIVAPEALIEFKDELDFMPDENNDGRPDVSWPNLVCRSGELYAHRQTSAILQQRLQRNKGRIQGLVSDYCVRLEQAREQGGPAPSSTELFQGLNQVLNETVFRSSASIPAEHPAAQVLAHRGDEVYEALPFHEYAPYRNKSYLTFTIVNHVPAENRDVLNELYARSAEQIERALNARVDMEQLSRDILALQDKASQAIISVLATRELERVEDVQTGAQKLRVLYPGHDELIDALAARVTAERDLRMLADPRMSGIEQRLRSLFGDEFGSRLLRLKDEQLTQIERTVREELPQLWPVAEPVLNAARALRKLEGIISPEELRGTGAPAISPTPPSNEGR